ncbi:MAG: phosphoglycolate phosphatase [Gammaproteobacteria bacterium]
MKPTLIKTVLFDLDGTLADTAPDLADALNRVLRDNQRPPLSFATIRPWVSHGGQVMIKNAFELEEDAPQFASLRRQFLDSYTANIARKTTLFPGMPAVLDGIEQRGFNWGVVTNKPAWLTEPLMAALDLHRRSVCTISGDTLAERKPHPAPLLHACKLAGSRPDECLYIGDAERDIIAGRQARMKTLVALFGYLDAHDVPADWAADDMIAQPEAILHWLDRYNQQGFATHE